MSLITFEDYAFLEWFVDRRDDTIDTRIGYGDTFLRRHLDPVGWRNFAVGSSRK